MLVSTSTASGSIANAPSAQPTLEQHPLEPFLPQGARVLLLGSFPPPRHRWRMEFFYPNFTNDMWRVMGLLLCGDAEALIDRAARTYRLDEIVALLTHHGIALYDSATCVERLRGTAADEHLRIVTPTDLPALIERLPALRAVAATGGKSAQEIARQLGISTMAPVGESVDFSYSERTLRFYRMPSTSRAYPLPLEKKAAAYARLLTDSGIATHTR